MKLSDVSRLIIQNMITDIEHVCRTVLAGNSDTFTVTGMTSMLRNRSMYWQQLEESNVYWVLEAMGIDIEQEEIKVKEFLTCALCLTQQVEAIIKGKQERLH